jgi:hypothetical protein
VNRHFPVSATRPDEPIRYSPEKKWLTGLLIFSSAAGLGYFLVRPLVIADQFDTFVATTDRCRIAAPGKNSDFVTKVRDMPDRNAAIKTKLAQGEKILFVSSKAEFVRIEQRNGYQGWVFNDQIRSCNAVAPSVSSSPEPTTSSTPPLPSMSKPKPQVSKSPSVIKKTSAPTPPPSSSSLEDPPIDLDSFSSPLTDDPAIIPTTSPLSPTPSANTVEPSIANPAGKSPSPSPSTKASPTPSTNSSNSSPEDKIIF